MYGWLVPAPDGRRTRIDVDPGQPLDHSTEWDLMDTIPDPETIDARKADIREYQRLIEDAYSTKTNTTEIRQRAKLPTQLAVSINIDQRIAVIIAAYTNPRFHDLLLTYEGCMLVEDDTGHYICFTGAMFLATLLISKDWSAIRDENQLMNLCESIPITTHHELFKMRGVYEIDLDVGHEGHSFVIYIKHDSVTILNTYGGYPEFFHITYPLSIYSAMVSEFITAPLSRQLELYPKLWGFRPEMISDLFYYLFDEVKKHQTKGLPEPADRRFDFKIEGVTRLF